jgi:hypothetical protein
MGYFHFRFWWPPFESRYLTMLGHVGSAITESGIIENVVVSAEIASPAVFVLELFPLL